MRRLLHRSKRLTVAREVARGVAAGRRQRAGDVATEVGAQSAGVPAAESAGYAEGAFASLLEVGGLPREEIEGARVLELGPGDNLGLALMLLGAGAREVVAVDRFAVARDPGHELEIYRALLDRMEPAARERAAAALREDSDPPLDPDRVRILRGLPVEGAAAELEPASFDLIVSIAVLQHTYDADAAFDAMDRLLAPGGRMLHQIDFNDLSPLVEHGRHPLTFLTVPDRLHRAMTRNLGGSNRRLVDYYRGRLDVLGYEGELRITRVVGEEGKLEPPRAGLVRGRDFGDRHAALLAEIRPRLRPEYAALPDEDLLAGAAFLTARKPG